MKRKSHRKLFQLAEEGKMNRKVVISMAIAALIVVASVAGVLATGPTLAEPEGAATAPSIINYQGALFDLATGDPVEDGDYVFLFSIYDVDTGGDPLWTETQRDTNSNGGGWVVQCYAGEFEPAQRLPI